MQKSLVIGPWHRLERLARIWKEDVDPVVPAVLRRGPEISEILTHFAIAPWTRLEYLAVEVLGCLGVDGNDFELQRYSERSGIVLGVGPLTQFGVEISSG